MLAAYLLRVRRLIYAMPNFEVENHSQDMVSEDRAVVRIRMRSRWRHLLEISEVIQAEGDSLVFIDYRYHLQDPDHTLIFRYDSAPHHPDVSTFPHHKHLPDAVLPSIKPTIDQVLREATDAASESPASGESQPASSAGNPPFYP